MNHKKLVFSLIAILMIAYPFIVYFTLNEFGPSFLALVLFGMILLRTAIRGNYREPEQYMQLILVGALCGAAAWFNSEELLRYYPVLMNLAFAGFFLFSLTTEKTLIEKFAEMITDDIPESGRKYMRTLCKVWVLVLLINAMISFYTACCLSLKEWAFYNGFLAYLILGGFMLLEYGYRRIYIKKFGEE